MSDTSLLQTFLPVDATLLMDGECAVIYAAGFLIFVILYIRMENVSCAQEKFWRALH